MDIITAFLRSARYNRNRVAVIDGNIRLTWQELAERAGRMASVLRALGVKHGGAVGMLSHTSARLLEFYLGVPWASGMMCPLNFRLSESELVEIVWDAGIEILFVDDAFARTATALKERVPQLRYLIYSGNGTTPAGMLALEHLLADSDPLLNSESVPGDVACLYYSGGTTGRPKGVMLTHSNVGANALNVAAVAGTSDEDRFLHCGPLFHVAAGARAYNSFLSGTCGVAIPRFEAREVLQAIETHRITMVSWVPTMINTIVSLPDFDRYDLSSLRKVFYGASQISTPLLKTFLGKFEGVSLFQAYGQTEVSPVATILEPRYHCLEGPFAGKLASVGRPAPATEVRVVGPDDHELPPNEVGEVTVRGPNVMKGYLNQPELTAEALRGGWMHSGDLGYFDEDGFLFIVDRIKDMIISGGENIYSAEVENVVATHPDVAECAVIGIPHEKWVEAVHAVVLAKEGRTLTAEMIVEHCRGSIGGYKVPRSVDVRTKPMPLSTANKILKSALREEYLAAQASSNLSIEKNTQS